MTDEIGVEYRYVCETCMDVLTPREVRQHVTDGCAAVAHLTRLDLWLTETVEECPTCGADTSGVAPFNVGTWPAWYAEDGTSVTLKPCKHVVGTEDLLNEHRE